MCVRFSGVTEGGHDRTNRVHFLQRCYWWTECLQQSFCSNSLKERNAKKFQKNKVSRCELVCVWGEDVVSVCLGGLGDADMQIYGCSIPTRRCCVAPLLPQFLSYVDISVRSSGLYIIILSCFLCVFLKGLSRRLFQLVLFSRTNLQRQEGFFFFFFVCLLLLLFSNYPNYWEPVFKMKVWMSGVGGHILSHSAFFACKGKAWKRKSWINIYSVRFTVRKKICAKLHEDMHGHTCWTPGAAWGIYYSSSEKSIKTNSI